jgi:hypothetical protein
VTLSGSRSRDPWGSSLFQKSLLTAILLSCITVAGAQTKPLPPGPMQAKVKATCTQCHNAARITEQHLTKEEWSTELDKMVGLGAAVEDADRPALLKYLSKNFGPAGSGKQAPKKTAEAAK